MQKWRVYWLDLFNVVISPKRKEIPRGVCVWEGICMCVCVGGGGLLYLTLHCHHQNDFCIKLASVESHFTV